MVSNKPKVVELFSGAGLFSLAFQQVGFRIVRAIELNPVAASTYARNLGDHVEVNDVTKAKRSGNCDVLIAGPPCQGFSTLGGRRTDDPRNALSMEVARWAKQLNPKIVVIENVSAFLDSAHWQRVARQFRRLGYSVDSFVLDAYDYGCPQRRRRSFTIANRLGASFDAPKKRKNICTVRQAWVGLPKKPNGANHHYSPTPSELALSRMRIIPKGGDKRDVMQAAPELTPPSWWKVSGEVTDAWGRMHWDEPCNTLRTCLQNPSKGRYTHPTQNRVITLREAARLHTIPDDWAFDGLPTQIAKQIGNSVPPSLGRAVARQVRLALRN